MKKDAKTFAAALIAGLISGSLALADEVAKPATDGASQAAPGNPAPKATKRKPHKEIINKNKCCKNGCDCMDAKDMEPKKAEPKK